MQINTLIKKGIIINLVSMRSGNKNLVCPTGIGSLSLNVILADCSIDALIDTSLCNRHYDIKCIIKYHQNLDTFPKILSPLRIISPLFIEFLLKRLKKEWGRS